MASRNPRSQFVGKIIDEVKAKALSNTEYIDLICSLFDEKRGKEANKPIYTYIHRQIERNKNAEEQIEKKKKSGVAVSGKAQRIGVASSRVSHGTGITEQQPTPPLIPKSIGAERVPFIFRGDLVPSKGQLFFDVEKISVKAANGSSHIQKAGSVAVVNEARDLILWSYIKTDAFDVCQYFPNITGLNDEKIGEGVPLDMVHKLLDMMLKDNELIGVAVQGDLSSLSYHHENTVDIQEYFKDDNNQPYSLKLLAGYFFNEENYQCEVHSAISDARMTRKLYKRMLFLRDVMKTPFKWNIRDKAPRTRKFIDVGDKCRCSITQKKGKKKKSKLFGPNWAEMEFSFN